MLFFKRQPKEARGANTKVAFLMLPFLLFQIATATPPKTTISDTEPLEIAKVSFLIHPVAWDIALTPEGQPSPSYMSLISDLRGGSWYDEKEFLEILAWEKSVNKKQLEYIDKMSPNEVLVIFPIGTKPAMRDIEQFAQNRLGRRCIIIRSVSPSQNEAVDYQKLMPAQIRLELADELLKTLQKNGDSWSARALEVIFYSRLLAMEIQEEFKKRSFSYDPQQVEAVAFGEGFEQCAMTWKAMLPHFLGLAKPIENDYALSVSGVPLLRTAVFKKRVALDNDIRLFLWELKDGRPMALYTRARANLSDPQFSVALPFQPQNVKVYDDGGKLLWPPNLLEKIVINAKVIGPVKVPVFTALRQFETDVASYIVASDISFDEFQEKLVKAVIESHR